MGSDQRERNGLIDERAAAYHLDQKSTIRFYLDIFFDLMDLAKWSKLLDLKLLIEPTWLKDTQVKAEHHQMTKQVPKESISISLSKVTYHHIFQRCTIFNDDVNINTKKELA